MMTCERIERFPFHRDVLTKSIPDHLKALSECVSIVYVDASLYVYTFRFIGEAARFRIPHALLNSAMEVASFIHNLNFLDEYEKQAVCDLDVIYRMQLNKTIFGVWL